MGTIASQITSLTIVYSTFIRVQIKVNIKAPGQWPFVRGIHRGPVNSPHKWPVTREMFPFDDVIMIQCYTRQIMSDLGQRKQISNKKGSLVN